MCWIYPKIQFCVVLCTLYPNLPVSFHRYTCHTCDILQLWSFATTCWHAGSVLKRALHEMGGWGNRVKVKKGIGWEIKSGKTGAVATSQKISASLSTVLKTSAMVFNQHSESEAAFKSARNCFKQPVVFSIAFKCQLKDVDYPSPHIRVGDRLNIYQ